MRLPDEKRAFFKEPQGELYESSEEAFEYLKEINFEEIITVGDVVSADFLAHDYKPDLLVVDYNVMRATADKEIRNTVQSYSVRKIEVENPPGFISDELWNAVESADFPAKIVVDGEEDLAAVPAVFRAREGSVVAYGQPGRGIVLIEVDEEKKKKFSKLLDLFKEV